MQTSLTRPLGNSGLVVSMVGLGCNNFGRPGTATETVEGTRAVLDAALEAGVTFLDTAESYGTPAGRSEELIGEAMDGRRDQFIIATKFGHSRGGIPGTEDWGPKGGSKYIRNAVDASLKRLQTDFIDLYQIHTPDDSTPITETLGTLNELVDEGKIGHYGHSNFSGAQTRAAAEAAEQMEVRPFVSAQNNYSLLVRDAESDLFDELRAAQVGFLPFFPLASGLLTGKYTEGNHPADGRLTKGRPEVLESTDWEQLREYQKICDEAGVSMLQATFGWLLSRDVVSSVIAGATTPEQVHSNALAGQTMLDSEVVDRIDKLFT